MPIRNVYRDGVVVATEEYPDSPPKTELYPFEFQRMLTSQQKAVIWNATEPPLTDLAVDLLTIVTPVPFTLGSPLHSAVLLLGQMLPQLFTEVEVSRILAQQPPE